MPKIYLIIFLIMLPTLLYVNSLSNSFQYDDLHTIVNNPHIRSDTLLSGLKKIPDFFTSSQYYSSETHQVGHYRPLLYATYVINYAITGLSPAGFRLVNLGLHIGCVIMVYLVALHLLADGTGAFLSALIFALHPFFSEAINYISARSSLLATLFYLLAFYYFVKLRGAWSVVCDSQDGARTTHHRSQLWVHFSLFSSFTLLAFLSKEIVLTLPLMLAVYDLLFTRAKELRQGFKISLPYFPMAIIGMFLLYKMSFIQFFTNIYITPYYKMNILYQLLAQIKGHVLMIWLYFFPLALSIDHGSLRPHSVFEPGVVAAVSVLLTILGCAFYLSQSQRGVSFPLFWFVITSLPTILVPLNIPLLENRGYLPGVGLAIVTGWSMGKVLSSRCSVLSKGQGSWGMMRGTGTVVLCALIFVLYAGITFHRNTIWKDEVSLWSDAVIKAPGSDRAWTNLGLAYLTKKDHTQALEAFEQAILINPDTVVARVGLGSSYHLQGKLDAAVQAYQDSIHLYPNYYLPHFNLGVAYQQQGQYEKALRAYQEVLKINAHHPETHLNLGGVYLALGQQDLAIAEYEEALKLNPGLADAHYNLGVIYEARGEANLAAQHYGEAERLR